MRKKGWWDKKEIGHDVHRSKIIYIRKREKIRTNPIYPNLPSFIPSSRCCSSSSSSSHCHTQILGLGFQLSPTVTRSVLCYLAMDHRKRGRSEAAFNVNGGAKKFRPGLFLLLHHLPYSPLLSAYHLRNSNLLSLLSCFCSLLFINLSNTRCPYFVLFCFHLRAIHKC